MRYRAGKPTDQLNQFPTHSKHGFQLKLSAEGRFKRITRHNIAYHCCLLTNRMMQRVAARSISCVDLLIGFESKVFIQN